MTDNPKVQPVKEGVEWFEIRSDGLAHIVKKEIKGKTVPIATRITFEPFEVAARTVPIDGDFDRGLVFRLKNREVILKHEDLTSENEIAKFMNSLGVNWEYDAKKLLARYFTSCRDVPTVTAYMRNGWQTDGAFVIGDKIIGGKKGSVALKPINPISTFEKQGTYDEWRKNVLPLARNKPGWIFSILVGLSSPLLKRVGATTGFIFNMTGPSSIGKSDALMAAANVWGRPDAKGCLRNFDFTINAIEVLAETHSDIGLPLDEMKRGDPAVVAQTIYKIANGAGKSRMTGDIEAHRLRNWLVNVIVSGEQTIEAMFEAAGIRQAGGQAVRAIDIAAEGLFPVINLEAVKKFEQAIMATYGVAGRVFIKQLRQIDKEALVERWDRATRDLYDGEDPRVQRIASGFAMLTVAGDIMEIETDVVRQAFDGVMEDGVMEKTDDCLQVAKDLMGHIGRNLGTSILPLRANDDFDGFGVDDGLAAQSYKPRDGFYLENTIFLFPEVLDKIRGGLGKKVFNAWAREHSFMKPRANRGWTHKVPGVKPEAWAVWIELDRLREVVGEDTVHKVDGQKHKNVPECAKTA